MIDTPGALYDELHRRYGIGTYDDSISTKPWWKARNVEISKIKAMMRRRKVKLEDLVLALEYLQKRRHPITESWHLFDVVTEAKQDRRRAEKEDATDVRTALADAAAEAMAVGEQDWAARLYNASDEAGAEVLKQWGESR